MLPLTSSPNAVQSLSAQAERLLAVFRAEPVRWIVLSHVSRTGAAGLGPDELLLAIQELEAADLVERAPYGPLLFIR